MFSGSITLYVIICISYSDFFFFVDQQIKSFLFMINPSYILQSLSVLCYLNWSMTLKRTPLLNKIVLNCESELFSFAFWLIFHSLASQYILVKKCLNDFLCTKYCKCTLYFLRVKNLRKNLRKENFFVEWAGKVYFNIAQYLFNFNKLYNFNLITYII